ncbi:MerR family transcriptional regulator [Hydrogenimonas sp.]
MGTKRYTMQELSRMFGMSPRTIRYYIQEGVIDKPEGQAKGAYYTERHLRQLTAVKKYKEMGLSLERIAELVRSEGAEPEDVLAPRRRGTVEVVHRIFLDDGLELLVDPVRAGLGSAEIRRLAKEIEALVDRAKKEQS